MAFYIVSAGGSLYQVSSAGVLTTLTLPAGVTIDATRMARMAVLGRNVVVVNASTRGLMVDPDQVVRPMGLTPPMTAPVLSAAGAGGLTGAYMVAYSHKVKNADGELLLESPLSPTSAAFTVAAQFLTAGFEVSPDSVVTHRGLYRTVAGGVALLPWFDVEGNTIKSFSDDLSDAELATVAAPTELGAPPGTVPGTFLTNIVEWKGRLWGVGDVDVDTLRYSGAGLLYGWPDDFSLDISPIGADSFGITGLIRRRDELGIAKRNIIWKITGDDPDTFEPIKVVEGKGVWATDSVVVIRDVAYFLAEDGVYSWGPDGVKAISDEKVRGWFATDTYFNRSKFSDAFAKYNDRYHSYELHLAAAGSSTIDRWVSYDITSGEWFGPHKTLALTPTSAGQIVDVNGLTTPVMLSSDGYIYEQNQSGYSDAGSAITMAFVTKSHSANTPDITKLFKRLIVIQKAQAAAGALAIGVAVGKVDAAVTKTFSADGRFARQIFPIIGPGRNVRLEFTEATLAQGCEIEGYEIPFGELGRR